MKPPAKAAADYRDSLPLRIFAAAFGAFLGLSLLKFGNPPIMEKWVSTPANPYEFLIATPWPVRWAYWLLAALAIHGLWVVWSSPRVDMAEQSMRTGISKTASLSRRLRLITLTLPLVWLLWQCLATADSLDPELSKATLKHFTACVVCFYLGLCILGRSERLWPFFTGLFLAFLIVLAVGCDQRFGGLEESRRYFLAYVYPHSHDLPPEYLKKLQSGRIFSTLFYPNALAGVLLLLLPAVFSAIWQPRNGRASSPSAPSPEGKIRSPGSSLFKRLRLLGFGAATFAGFCLFWFGSRGSPMLLLLLALALVSPAWKQLVATLLAAAGLACLFWSGSKGGWLLMLLLGLIALLRLPIGKRFRFALVTGVLLLGLAGFFWKYSGFFQKGATSVSARFDYWRAALQTAKDHPLLGTGPGTFAIPYAEIKLPESEMSRLAHNDYLEQASDSGIVGFLVYNLFIVGALVLSFPKAGREPFAVWLGVLGWALQGLIEFGLYLPALAWPAFAFLGWLFGRNRNPMDKVASPP